VSAGTRRNSFAKPTFESVQGPENRACNPRGIGQQLSHASAAFFLGKNDVPYPGPQRCLFVWGRRGVSAGKGFNQWIFSAHPLMAAGFSLDFNASQRIPLEDYSKAAIQFHKGFRSSTSSAIRRTSLSRSMACRSRAFASSVRPVTLA
jgi:hypothetical protein